VRQLRLQLLHHEVQFVAARLVRLDMHLVMPDDSDVLVFHLKLGCFKYALSDCLDGDLQLQCINRCQINLDRKVAARRRVNFFNVLSDISKFSFLDTAFHDTCGDLTTFILESSPNNRCRDFLRSIDDFFNARYTQSDIHGGDTSEMESFQGHLSGGLSDRLCGYSTTGFTGLNLGALISAPDKVDKFIELASGQVVEIVQKADGAAVVAVFTNVEEDAIDF